MTAENVTPIRPGAYDPSLVSSGEVIDPDRILEAHKGMARQLVLVTIDHAGVLHVAGSHGVPDSHMLLHLGMIDLCKAVAEDVPREAS